MQSSVDINQFFELMDHEFNGISTIPNKNGYRVDRSGIKNHCNCSSLKSVDYFYEKNDKLAFIEFSDLARQHSSVLERIDNFKRSGLDRKEITRNVRRLHREIGSEVRTKFLESLHIIDQLPNFFENIPYWMLDKIARLIIVVAPISDDDMDIIRVYEKLKDDLTGSIPDNYVISIRVISVDSFFK